MLLNCGAFFIARFLFSKQIITKKKPITFKATSELGTWSSLEATKHFCPYAVMHTCCDI